MTKPPRKRRAATEADDGDPPEYRRNVRITVTGGDHALALHAMLRGLVYAYSPQLTQGLTNESLRRGATLDFGGGAMASKFIEETHFLLSREARLNVRLELLD